MFDFYFFAKIIVLLFLWAFILIGLSILVFSRKIYIALRESEDIFNQSSREAARSLTPFLLKIASYNSNVQKLIGVRRFVFSDLVSFISPFLFANSFKGFKTGLTLTKKVLSKN